MKSIMKKALALAACLALLAVVLVPSAGAAGAGSRAGTVSVAYGSLNVRASAGTSGTILTSLPKGTTVTLLSQANGWWKVEYAPGRIGYASAKYITPVSGSWAAYVGVSSGYLNVRTGPSTAYGIKTSLPKGAGVVVLSSSGGWSRILYRGTQVGYSSSAYLKSYGGSTQRTGMLWPTSGRTLAQYFASGSHNGIDISPLNRGVAGDRVVSAVSGTVVYSGWLGGYGYVVYVNSVHNGQYIQTRYAHLACPPDVHVGNAVYAGQTIGYMGNSGTSTGVHLHFEVRIRKSSGTSIPNADSTPVNPLNYVSP